MNVKIGSLVEAATVVLGLWILVAKIPDSLILLFAQPFGPDEFEPLYMWLIAARILVYLIIGLGLILARKRFVRYIDSPETLVRSESPTILSGAIALLGVYFFALGAVALGEALVIEFQQNHSAPSLYARGGASLTAGVLLFICSGGLSRAWAALMKLRTAGV